MEDQELLNQEIESKQQHEERKRAVWSALEQQGTLPDRDELGHFSNLLREDINRAESFWAQLDTEVRRNLIETLNEVADTQVVMDFTAIFRIALHDQDPGIRENAIHGLREVEDVRLVPLFIELLHHDATAGVRRAAARMLANFVLLGELEKIRPAPFNAAVLALRERYTDPAEDLDVRRHAMESLAYTGEYDVPKMIETAYAHADEAMRQSAVVAMGRSADPRWSGIVRQELHNPSPAMRLEATRAAGELQLRVAVREVIELVEDTDSRIRAAALWALGQIGGNLARKTLQSYIGADDAALREVAEQALQELEFFYGDLTSFFGPPEDYDGETEELWQMPGLGDLSEDEDEIYSIREDDLEDEEDDLEDEEDLYIVGEDDDDQPDDDALYFVEDDEDDTLLDDLALIEALNKDDDEDEEEDRI